DERCKDYSDLRRNKPDSTRYYCQLSFESIAMKIEQRSLKRYILKKCKSLYIEGGLKEGDAPDIARLLEEELKDEFFKEEKTC
ncbi:MAG: hypothetical protein KAV87_33125, partial [Desulfobacteraceae bacterium]|nr:hypothetical protein [Desulfobacteraceae bacterium]